MRCKNCKKKVENENLLRCPHCGKMMPKKKQIDKKKLILTIGFVLIAVSCFVFSFLSFFFKSSFYSSAVMIVGIILFAICIPFMLGGFAGVRKKHTELFAAIASIPFIANWFAVFIKGSESVDFGGFSTAYNWIELGLVLICDVVLMLSFAEIIKNTKVMSFIALGFTAVSLVLTPVYFSTCTTIRAIGIIIITIQTIMPTYMAFYTLNKEE